MYYEVDKNQKLFHDSKGGFSNESFHVFSFHFWILLFNKGFYA